MSPPGGTIAAHGAAIPVIGFGTGSLTIEADYSVPVTLPGYSTTLDFHPSSKNKGVF